MNLHNSALTVRNTATTPITLKRLANLNLSCALFFSTHARQTASLIWGSLSACNMNFLLTQTSLLYSQIERDVCFIIHLYWLSKMEDAIATWEDEGGSSARTGEHQMIGTVNQIAWAVQIKAQVDAEFDRVRKVLESVATKQSPNDRTDLQAIIRILEDKRREVMGNKQAGYFIQDWQELRDQVRQLIIGDPRYKAIKANQTVRFMPQSTTDSKDPPSREICDVKQQ